ncbi:hypothetical protein Q2941_44520 [Bradyrhizobium sp. UFLA05-153]
MFVADVLGGIVGFSAMQTAMVQRARTGEGQHIDVVLDGLHNEPSPLRAAGSAVGPVRASDGDILIAPVSARTFPRSSESSAMRFRRVYSACPQLMSDGRPTQEPLKRVRHDVMSFARNRV